MNYYDDLLIEPIEIELPRKQMEHPDTFRRYLFGKETLDSLSNPKFMAQYTNTKEKYWDYNYDIIAKIDKILKLYSNDKNIIDVINDKISSKKTIQYFNHMYDLIDIAIMRFNFRKNSFFHDLIASILKHCGSRHLFAVRIIFYVDIYFLIKIVNEKNLSYPTFLNSSWNKFNEIIDDPKSCHVFTLNEISNYRVIFKKIKDQYDNLLKNKK